VNWITDYQIRCFRSDGRVLLTARTNTRIWEQRSEIESGLKIKPGVTDMVIVKFGPPMVEQVLFDRRKYTIEEIRKHYKAL